jgi:hypothetical protein
MLPRGEPQRTCSATTSHEYSGTYVTSVKLLECNYSINIILGLKKLYSFPLFSFCNTWSLSHGEAIKCSHYKKIYFAICPTHSLLHSGNDAWLGHVTGKGGGKWLWQLNCITLSRNACRSIYKTKWTEKRNGVLPWKSKTVKKQAHRIVSR